MILIVENGINDVKLRIIKPRIQEQGGALLPSNKATFDSLFTTKQKIDLITAKTFQSLSTYLKIGPQRQLPQCVILHTVDWITVSLERGKICTDEEFQIVKTHSTYSAPSIPKTSKAVIPITKLTNDSLFSCMSPQKRTETRRLIGNNNEDDLLDESPLKRRKSDSDAPQVQPLRIPPSPLPQPPSSPSNSISRGLTISCSVNEGWLSLPVDSGGNESEEEKEDKRTTFDSKSTTTFKSHSFESSIYHPITASTNKSSTSISNTLITPVRAVLEKHLSTSLASLTNDTKDDITTPPQSPTLTN